MKLKRLHLENFRKHADSMLIFNEASFVVVRGKNFAGKSTIGQAISMCLTPSTTGLATDGKGYLSKIKRGADMAVITADIQGKRNLIQRVVTLSVNGAGRTQKSVCPSDPDWRPENFNRQLEENEAALTVCLNTDAFLRMDEKKQKNLLARLALPLRYDFDKRMVEAVAKVLGKEAPNFEGEPFEVINDAYEKLFEERKIANRQVRDFVIPEPPAVGPTVQNSKALEEQLNNLREERRQRVQERDRAVAEASGHQLERVRLKSRIETLEEAVRKEQDKADALKAKLQPDDKLAYLRKLASGRTEQVKLEKEYEQKVNQGNRDRDLAAQLEQAFKECPTCEQSVDEQRLAHARVMVERRVVEGREAVRMLEQKIRALGDVGAAAILIDGHEKTLKELADMDAAMVEKRRQLEQETNALPVVAEFDFQPYDRTIAECDAEMERVAGLLRPAIAAEERVKEIAVKQSQLKGLKERAGLLDVLVKYFDKDGIKAKLIGRYIGGFEAKLNEVLNVWKYACALTIEPYSFDIKNASGDVIPVRELSGAERVMFSAALQCAVSRTANVGLVVIDEVATLLPELRAGLNKRLYEMVQSGYLEQAILLVSDTSELVPNLAGAGFFMVEKGEVRKLCRDDHGSTISAHNAEEVRPSHQNAV